MRALLALMFAVACSLAACATDTDSTYGTQTGALQGGCRTICPKCPANQICPMMACYIDCNGPQQCVQTQMCIIGYKWSSQKCACIPDKTNGAAGKCSTDADCRIVSDYCGGCFCDALSKSQPDPSCVSTVKCAMDPCTGHSASCVGGFCQLQ